MMAGTTTGHVINTMLHPRKMEAALDPSIVSALVCGENAGEPAGSCCSAAVAAVVRPLDQDHGGCS